jgi:hypothetical protein
LKYYCGDLGRFYFSRDELHPININNVSYSSFNNKIIKGRVINIKSKIKLSQTQGLEFFKNCSFIPFSFNEGEDLFVA